MINVASLGVDPYSTLDQRDKIQASIDLAGKKKESLFFPAGTYFCHAPLEVKWSQLKLFGEDRSLTRLRFLNLQGPSPHAVLFGGTAGTEWADNSLAHLEIDTKEARVALKLNGQKRFKAENLVVKGSDLGLEIVGGSSISLDDVYLRSYSKQKYQPGTGWQPPAGPPRDLGGLRVESAKSVRLYHCWAESSGHGMVVRDSDVFLWGCTIQSNRGYGIKLDYSTVDKVSQLYVVSSHFENNWDSNVYSDKPMSPKGRPDVIVIRHCVNSSGPNRYGCARNDEKKVDDQGNPVYPQCAGQHAFPNEVGANFDFGYVSARLDAIWPVVEEKRPSLRLSPTGSLQPDLMVVIDLQWPKKKDPQIVDDFNAVYIPRHMPLSPEP